MRAYRTASRMSWISGRFIETGSSAGLQSRLFFMTLLMALCLMPLLDSAVESQLIVLMSRMKIDMSIASEAVNPGFTPDEAFASGEVEEVFCMPDH